MRKARQLTRVPRRAMARKIQVPLTGLALICVALIGGAPSPALAGVVPTTALTVPCGYGQTCNGAAQSVPIGTANEVVTFACTTTTPYVVEATGAGCYLVGADNIKHWAVSLWANGLQSATGSVTGQIPQQPYQLCMGGGYIDTFGNPFPIANFSCTAPL
jgi:hypothetical protein